jgi:CheY-like chemotaxis protein
MPKSITIALGETPYVIQEFTLGQLEDLHSEIAHATNGEAAQLWQRFRKIILIALSVDHPGMTEETLKRVRLGTLPAVKAVTDSILEFAGFVPRHQQATPGEVEARAH